ncbi:Transcription factor iws1 [Mortierella claussenii]|nr:Transcription factor iws1 [Mortierella claussenii]
MSSDKNRILRDTFGEDDDEDDSQSLNGDRDYQDQENSHQEDGLDDAGKEGAQDVAAGDEEEEEEEGTPLPSFKKRNADGEAPATVERKKKKVAKKPRPASSEGGQNLEGGEDLPLDPRQQALLKLEMDFAQAMKSGKTSSRKRGKDDDMDLEKDLDESAARFVAKMREAAFSDIDSKVKHQSALAKVKMLESIKKQLNKYGYEYFLGMRMPCKAQWNGKPLFYLPTQMATSYLSSRSHMHSIFLDNGILEAMKLWLEPLQDSSLPSLDIIQDFLDLMDGLDIQTHHLVSSGVGRVVYFYTKVDDSRVTPGIKRKAQLLVDKWSRPIMKLSQDYREKKINYADDSGAMASSQRRRPTASSTAEAPGPKTLGVRVPQIDRGSYVYMPESSISYDKSRGGKASPWIMFSRLRLKSHMAKMKQVKRT